MFSTMMEDQVLFLCKTNTTAYIKGYKCIFFNCELFMIIDLHNSQYEYSQLRNSQG